LKEQIGSAYLRAAFAFLCADSIPGFAEELDQYEEMSLSDRIAFGCRFLPHADVLLSILSPAPSASKWIGSIHHAKAVSMDVLLFENAQLQRYITQSATATVKNGCLAGLMLTGLSVQGVDLLENYINRTGDVQTVASPFSGPLLPPLG